MKTPFISVVIPTFNRAKKTIAAIESVLAQTYAHHEIIVVNDGSTDGSTEVIEKYLSDRGYDKEYVRYFKQPNQGVSVARNVGIENARGEYVAFLDSDDAWLPEKLEWQVRAVEEFDGECGAFFTDSQVVEYSCVSSSFQKWGLLYTEEMGIERQATQRHAKSFCGLWMSTLMARTDLVKQIGGFDPKIVFCEDRDLYFRLSRVTSFAYVNKELVRIDRIVQPNDSEVRPWSETQVRLRGEEDTFEKWLSTDKTMPPDVQRIVRQNLRNIHSQWANWYLENGRYTEASESVSRALQYEFTLGLVVKRTMTSVAPAVIRKFTAKSKPYIA